MEEKIIRITWTGPDQYHFSLGKLTAGMTIEVPADMAGPWIRDGWAEAIRPEPKPKKPKPTTED